MTELRQLGGTGIKIAPLVFGGNVFGWTLDQQKSFEILDAFVAGGGTMIDTADVYAVWAPGNKGGESEEIIGAWLKQSGKRDKVQIATKVGTMPGEGGEKLQPSRIAAGFEESLRRLQTDYVDVYFAHLDDENTPQDEVMTAFSKLVDSGKVRALGASNYGAARLKSANDVARAAGLPRYEVLQPHYNLVAREQFEGELQDYCVTNNVGVIPYFALASGFLTGKYRSEEDLSKSVRGGAMGVPELVRGSGLDVLKVMDTVVEETGATHAQVALAWLAAQPGITAPIASATSAAQLEELLGSMSLKLSPEQLERLDNAGA